MDQFLVRVPDHLGDGVMAIPAVRAISEVGPVQIVGPKWSNRLYANIATDVPFEANVAVLFKPSFSAAWKTRHLPRRIGHRGDWRSWLLTDPVRRRNGHRTEDYAALAQMVNATVLGPPTFETTIEEKQITKNIPAHSVLLLPLSNSQATVGWKSFRHLADHLGGRAIFAAGPGECEALQNIAGIHPCLPPLPVGQFGAVAQHVSAVVGNDSGLSHLASAARRAVGLRADSIHVFFGSTTPHHTGPIGCTVHQNEPLSCQPCYRKQCRTTGDAPCLDIGMTNILQAIH